jgi:hypothetical protein
LYSLSVRRGRIEYEGETSVYTQISPLKIRGKDEYILTFPGGKIVCNTVSLFALPWGVSDSVSSPTYSTKANFEMSSLAVLSAFYMLFASLMLCGIASSQQCLIHQAVVPVE